jgi:hypothetical protein
MSITVPIDDPQPSQLYVDAASMREMLAWFDPEAPSYDPIPVIELGGDRVLTDGHTRAVLAHLAGADELRVVPDPDREELPLAMYRECVEWCRVEGVEGVPDLVGRVVSHERFHEDWVERCHASPHYE